MAVHSEGCDGVFDGRFFSFLDLSERFSFLMAPHDSALYTLGLPGWAVESARALGWQQDEMDAVGVLTAIWLCLFVFFLRGEVSSRHKGARGLS